MGEGEFWGPYQQPRPSRLPELTDGRITDGTEPYMITIEFPYYEGVSLGVVADVMEVFADAARSLQSEQDTGVYVGDVIPIVIQNHDDPLGNLPIFVTGVRPSIEQRLMVTHVAKDLLAELEHRNSIPDGLPPIE